MRTELLQNFTYWRGGVQRQGIEDMLESWCCDLGLTDRRTDDTNINQ
ncbi:MAG: hypothetical protein MUC60_04075 [Oscillatoria sp. Prado101]|nr:hypothetical protein [Oscillatoria sp. Prado101]